MNGATSGWGREQAVPVAAQLVSRLESLPDQRAVKISMMGVERMDASFASEAIVEVLNRYRKSKGICLIDLSNSAIRLNIDLAAERIGVPITVWNGTQVEVIGLKPSAGNREALDYALSRAEVRTAAFAEATGISIANASTKFKQLWEQGFLMRTEGAADSGGVEFLYRRIG
ncbi:MAG: hypothetical protein KF730_13545 [Sphingomonas sp.]|uniref:hypothetical protein n=1 Tax=Sphingomonas sp. TaxID=28214 RepID=UPI0025EDBF88|nr:hypothetical protein [Sphingomonas sp.]MBX3565588.1 hypothetical protein [Sphingomonas sp.]